jgi:hypothetical protein
MMIKNDLFKGVVSKRAGGMLPGSILGVMVGTGIGGFFGYFNAKDAINNTPVETVTLTYKEPIYVSKEIGKIPEDKYDPKPDPDWFTKPDTPTVPVIKEVPVKDENGRVVYKEVTKTFSGHGKPVINYETKEVKEPAFLGWNKKITEDVRKKCYTDSNLKQHCTRITDRLWIEYSPKIDYNVIDTYEKPEVKFDHGVNEGKYVFTGMLVGTAIGAAIGGIIGFLFDI